MACPEVRQPGSEECKCGATNADALSEARASNFSRAEIDLGRVLPEPDEGCRGGEVFHVNTHGRGVMTSGVPAPDVVVSTETPSASSGDCSSVSWADAVVVKDKPYARHTLQRVPEDLCDSIGHSKRVTIGPSKPCDHDSRLAGAYPRVPYSRPVKIK